MDSQPGNAKRAGACYDSRALIKQLQHLWLNDDDDVLDQILTISEPEALSELSTALNSKSVIPLVTEKDGREFFIHAGLLAYSNWDGQYPMEFSPAIKFTRKLSDPTLADEKITTYQNDALKEILDAVCATEDAVEFRKPVQVLRPKIWDSYKALIADPIDLETMQHKLYHRTYSTMWGFRRHVDLLEENAQEYNGDRNASIVAAAIKVRSDIYHRMNEIPAEPPLGHHGVSLVRRIIYADDHGSASAAGSVVEASHKGAKNPGARVRHTDNPTYFLPLGRLGVARKAGDKEVVATPYIVMMEVESSYRPLWLIKDNYTPVGLPSDKKALLDFGGQYNFTIAKLAGDIDEWKPISDGGSKGNKPPALRWGKVKDLIRKTSQDIPVIFDVVEDQQQAKAAIEEGWDRTTVSPERAELNSFVVGDGIPGDRNSNYSKPAAALHEKRGRRGQGLESYNDSSDSDYTSDESDESGEYEPPSKRTRAANRAR